MTPFLERFLAVLDASPMNEAIEDRSGGTYSYQELWRRACAIAVDGPVILEKGRGVDHVAGMLAAMRARVPFVPLDPSTPKARRDFVRADIARGVSKDVAYVIYTSGSTGVPKGVEVGHDGLVPMLDEQRRAFEVDATTRFYWMLSPGFDASISDIGVTLLSGGTLFCAPHAPAVSHLEVMRTYAITHADVPPSLLAMLDPAHAGPTLRTIVIGGEVAPKEAVRRWSRHVRVVSVYGPTEATICTSMVTCDPTWDRPRIGKPLPHVKYEVRDGELWIGGLALARGYRGRPDLDAEKLVIENGERFYRTGDRVARLPDGDLEFVGRLDRQLKIRGQLVEPEEIERRLTEHPRVGRAAVVKHDRAGLVAFVAGQVGERELRARLGETLPTFMIPARVVRLETLPETSSGKVDLEKLETHPLPRNARSGEPTTEREKMLVRIWASVLDRGEDEVGLDDELALLGADSLAVLRFGVAAEAEGINLSPRAIARASTIRALLEDHAEDRVPIAFLEGEVARFAKESPARGWPTKPQRVLLTGATGRVGRHILAHLLDDASFEVIALVRRSSDLDPRSRILYGDLAQERFGLDARAWAELAEDVDAIVHAGARVSALASYGELRAPNVIGTANVIELARSGRAKALHHVSTLSIFVDGAPTPQRIREDDDGTGLCSIRGGYAQSKWVSEQLVRRARLPGSIVRLGLVTGDAADPLLRFVREIAQRRRAPNIADHAAVDVTSPERVAKVIGALAHEPCSEPRTFHVAGERRVSFAEVLDALAAEGHPVERSRSEPAVDLFDERPFTFEEKRVRSFVAAPEIDLRALVREALR